MLEHLFLPLTDLDWRPGFWTGAGMLGDVLALLSIPSVLLARRGRPQGALAWILVLMTMPYAGMLCWWLIGRRHLDRPRRRHRAAAARIASGLSARALGPGPATVAPLLPLATIPSELNDGVFPALPCNELDVLIDASEAYPALEEAIRGARHHVHLLFYIWEADGTGTRFRDLLIERAKAGVEVRLLYDAVGSPDLDEAFLAPLRAVGGLAAPFLPVRIGRRMTLNFRNHRKIVVIDGSVAYTGGINIGDEYTRDWHDLGLLMAGPVVAQLQEVFADDWLFSTGEDLARRPYFGDALSPVASRPGAEDPAGVAMVLASGPDTPHNLTHDAIFLAITEAKRRIWLVTPYFIPSPTLLVALRTAVYRGVDVRLMLPARSDVPVARLAARSYYPEVLASGVRVFEYGASVLHAKMLLFDEDRVLLGSANLDTRSFRLNFEAGVLVASPPVNAAMAELFERDLAQSHEVTPAELEGRPWREAVIESAAHLLSPLL